MKALGAVLAGFVAVVVLVGVIVAFQTIGFYNIAVRTENGIEAQYTQNKNNYDNYFKKLKEVAQVPEMYASDLRKLYDGTMKGRYGANGSKAVFQWIQEHNPTVDASIYARIQTVVESGRNSFEADQKSLIDKKREYANLLKTFPNNLLAGFLGLPKIDLNKYDIVTSEETEDTFEKKKSEPIKLR